MDKFLSSIYVDDLVSRSRNLESTYELHTKAKLRLDFAGFKLRKFVTNSEELHQFIQDDELSAVNTGTEKPAHAEEYQSYAKSSLGVRVESGQNTSKVLGVQWDAENDELCLDIGEVTHVVENCNPTKRSAVSIAVRFFDPIGIVSPVIILFKIFCQHLCTAKVGWDKPLTGHHLDHWNHLQSILREAKPITIPHCVYNNTSQPSKSARLIGFCDASSKAYAPVVYVRLEDETRLDVKFLASKTRVTPVGGMTIPQ